jgi:hypothetical protein
MQMSQVNVERVIGMLATDEGVRHRFTKNPRALLAEMSERGMELNDCERWSLLQLSPSELARFAQAIGPRLQKADLRGGQER